MPFPREEVEAAVQAFLKAMDHMSAGGDIVTIFDGLYTDDAVYVEHEFGTARGRKAILEWAASTLKDNPLMNDIKFRWEWHMIDGDRVVFYHHDGFADPRGNGIHEVDIVSILEYGGNGRWSYQEDIYNAKEFDRVVANFLAAKAEVETERQGA